jgi:Flp pilus assembly protein TadG
MKPKVTTPKRNKAQAMVEFAIALPILLLLVYGLIETGRLIFIYSTVVTASRQAVRYGSATGIGNSGVPHYRDCAGIKAAANKADYLNAFDDSDIRIFYDSGAGVGETEYCLGGIATDTKPTTTTLGDNKHRIVVRIDGDFNPIVPNLVPFIARTSAGGNPIRATSARTVLLSVAIEVPDVPGQEVTSLTVSDTPDPSLIGLPVTVTVTVSGTVNTPTGTVQISGADTNCTITLSNGTGSCNVTFNSEGTKTITAIYIPTPNSNFLTSSGSTPHTVMADAIVSLTDLPDPSLVNDAVDVAVVVTGGTTTPTGTVDIKEGGITLCTITLSASGTGNCPVTFSSTGTKTLTAVYSGDAYHNPKNSTEIHDVIIDAQTITQITGHTPNPSEINQAVTVSVRVLGMTIPTGTVEITGADTTCTITLSNGVGSCDAVFNSPGPKSITATYSGDADQNPSSTSVGHSVSLWPTVTVITADNPDPSSTGQTVTVSVSVTGGATAPTGTVAITGADTNCTITLPAASCDVVFNSTGTKTLIATYSGDGQHAPSDNSAAPASHLVTLPPVSNCNLVAFQSASLTKSGSTMSAVINNPTGAALQVSSITVFWNQPDGHQTGGDKTLNLTSASLGGTVFWSDATGITTTPYTVPLATTINIPATPTSTIAFTFHQSYDNWKTTPPLEYISITLSGPPGCENRQFQISR